MISDPELEDICEEVLKELFDEGFTVEECGANLHQYYLRG